MSGQPHDRFFKALFQRSDTALALLQERLPAEIAAALVAEPPVRLDTGFIDPSLASHQSDLLLRARGRDGRPVYVYCLIEHKSWVDRWVPLQLLRYLTLLWLRLAELPEHREKLPFIVPLVVYHGPGRWNGPTRFSDLLEYGSPDWLRWAPELPLLVVDLGQTPDEQLSRQPLLAAGFRLLKHGFALPAGEQVDALAWLLSGFAGDLEYLVYATSYILTVHSEVTRNRLRTAVRRVAPGKEDEVLSKAALELMEEARLKVEAEGELKGKRALLLRLLERRFGQLPGELPRRIENADGAQLDLWFDRVLDARTLAEVFDSGQR